MRHKLNNNIEHLGMHCFAVISCILLVFAAPVWLYLMITGENK